MLNKVKVHNLVFLSWHFKRKDTVIYFVENLPVGSMVFVIETFVTLSGPPMYTAHQAPASDSVEAHFMTPVSEFPSI